LCNGVGTNRWCAAAALPSPGKSKICEFNGRGVVVVVGSVGKREGREKLI
jgi:hypothetical protein